jgi:hypothetical protein
MANESTPDNPLPVDFVPEGSVETHRVNDGEDWASVAAQYNVKVDDLIYFNFHTSVPEEVNWYLRRNTGCNVSNDGGLNWAFSSSADPGLIYIPPSEVIDMEPDEDITVDTRTIMERLREIAKTIGGNEGIRIREMLDIAARVGSPADEQLWYYNGQAVLIYINFYTHDSERREMTRDTNGQFPFDGDAGVNFGMWRFYPFRDILRFCALNPNDCSDTYLKNWLINHLDQIKNSWEKMREIHDRGGGTTEGLVADFLDHVHDLAEIPTHLYFVYQEH